MHPSTPSTTHYGSASQASTASTSAVGSAMHSDTAKGTMQPIDTVGHPGHPACQRGQGACTAGVAPHRTCGLKILRRMGLSEMPLLWPTVRSVSLRISWRMRSKS